MKFNYSVFQELDGKLMLLQMLYSLIAAKLLLCDNIFFFLFLRKIIWLIKINTCLIIIPTILSCFYEK